MTVTISDQGLYIFLLSIHGLVRGEAPELGRDADTGGQVTYVLELARALSEHPGVGLVELLTRQIEDPALSSDYAASVEPLSEKARILRLPFGPKRYIRKELLWNHLDSLVDRILWHFRAQGRIPDVIHTHYADAGYVGLEVSRMLGIPLIHTGHSLGRPKRAGLLESGMREETIERQFHISRRIDVEERILRNAALIIASTHQEVNQQYAGYESGRHNRFAVIPPGTDTGRFYPPDRDWEPGKIKAQVDRFLADERKPMILTISRAAPKKNLGRLLQAFAQSRELQDAANLIIIAGNRDDISQMEEAPRQVLTGLLMAIDRYDLYGLVAVPKHHRNEDVPELYRLAVKRRGVFVNPALTEPFGLTLIEAAASGLPVVATADGGPRDIVKNCRNGLLVDPNDSAEIAAALLQAVQSGAQWRAWSQNGLRGVSRHYTWKAHIDKYLRLVCRTLARNRKTVRRSVITRSLPSPSRLPTADRWLISDIDNTLIGDREALKQLLRLLKASAGQIAFGVATGRELESALKILDEWGVPLPDVLITSVGSEIYYGPDRVRDDSWAQHIRSRWRREAIEEALREIPGLKLQPRPSQRDFKISYNIDAARFPPLAEVRRHIHSRRLMANFILSHGTYLDILPIRASKGRAIKYLAYRWGLPLGRTLVAGDSGNDEEMLKGDTLGVVVGNYSPELERLRGTHQVYFAGGKFARGILESLRHYAFLPMDAKGKILLNSVECREEAACQVG